MRPVVSRPRRPESPARVVEYARQLRSRLTPSERKLWLALSSGAVSGVCFRRQVELGRYVADFLAPRAWLVVEVDGPCHAGRRSADARRDRALQRMGYRVLRVEASLVIENLPAVLALISAALARDLGWLAGRACGRRHAVRTHRFPAGINKFSESG